MRDDFQSEQRDQKLQMESKIEDANQQLRTLLIKEADSLKKTLGDITMKDHSIYKKLELEVKELFSTKFNSFYQAMDEKMKAITNEIKPLKNSIQCLKTALENIWLSLGMIGSK